jgi:hypothetical protein
MERRGALSHCVQKLCTIIFTATAAQAQGAQRHPH